MITSMNPSGILSALFKSAVLVLKIKPNKFNHLQNVYIAETNKLLVNTTKPLLTLGNLDKELFNKNMTWKVFIKAHRVIEVKKLTFILTLHHLKGVSTHMLHVTLDDYILDNPDKLLKQLFWKIMLDLGIPENKFDSLIIDFIIHLKRLGTSAKKIPSKSVVKKPFESDRISWKTFIRGIYVLKIKQCDIHTEIEMKTGGTHTTAIKTINLFEEGIDNE